MIWIYLIKKTVYYSLYSLELDLSAGWSGDILQDVCAVCWWRGSLNALAVIFNGPVPCGLMLMSPQTVVTSLNVCQEHDSNKSPAFSLTHSHAAGLVKSVRMTNIDLIWCTLISASLPIKNKADTLTGCDLFRGKYGQISQCRQKEWDLDQDRKKQRSPMIWALFSVSGSHVARGKRASIHTLSLLWGIGMLYVRERVKTWGWEGGMKKEKEGQCGGRKRMCGRKIKRKKQGKKEGTKENLKHGSVWHWFHSC